MLTVIMAGGKGSRILEETRQKPKALVTVGDRPILEHIMDSYTSQGFCDFLILTGYRGEMIADYFRGKPGRLSCEKDGDCLLAEFPGVRVRVLYTGEETGSAARLRMAQKYIEEDCFMLTYCDGLCAVPFRSLVEFHRMRGGTVTVTAVRPRPRFGVLDISEDGAVRSFREKSWTDFPFINGGFMVMEREIFDFLTEETEQLERDVLVPLAEQGRLNAYKYCGFWQCMDTMQEKQYLNSLWEQGARPWISRNGE